MEEELPAQPGLSQSLLALAVGHDGHVHLLQDVLVGPGQAELVLPPAADPAPVAREILEDVRQADRRDVGVLLEVQTAVQFYQSNVVVEITGVELRVVFDLQDVHLHVGEGLVVAVHIPLPQPHSELLRPELVDAVRGRDEVTRVDQGGSTGVDIVVLVLLEYGRL